MNLANKITIARILLIPFFITCVLYHRLGCALVVFCAAVLSDAADGFVARHFNQKTNLGAMLDPVADKLLVLSGFLCFILVKDLRSMEPLPPYVPLVVISRDAIILLGSLFIILSKGRLEVRPTVLGKLTTFLQMLTLLLLLIQFRYAPLVWNIMVCVTVISCMEYVAVGSRMLNPANCKRVFPERN
ncbi:MAG: CDP-alcohol phosphatidyltransferase family protein [Candidatus Omnitrophica bacterium]|nr:CDP-alcohol phosphatidyltransferase family protein [Candidatus Omnitrophota bacterium]